MGKSKRRKENDPNYGKNKGFGQTKDFLGNTVKTYGSVRETVRIYKVVNGNIEDCCHSDTLSLLEKSIEFKKDLFFLKFDQPLQDGYYYVDHSTKRGNYVKGSFEYLIQVLRTKGLAN